MTYESILGGQLKLGRYSFDGAISYTTAMGEHQLEIVNFHASFTHGCEKTCSSPRVQYAARAQISNATDVKIRSFLSCLAKALGITIKFNIVSDCPHHRIEHHDSNDDERLLKGPRRLSYQGRGSKTPFFKKNFNFFFFFICNC